MHTMMRMIRRLVAVGAVALVLSGLGAEVAEARRGSLDENPPIINVVVNNPG